MRTNNALAYLNNAEATPTTPEVILVDKLYSDEEFMNKAIELKKRLELAKLEYSCRKVEIALEELNEARP